MKFQLKNLVIISIVSIAASQSIGEECVDKYSNKIGKCKDIDYCESAKEDNRRYGTQPTICSYYHTTTLICCRDGLDNSQTSNRNPQPNDRPIWSSDTSNRIPDSAPKKRISVKKCEEYSKSVTQTTEFITLTIDPEVMEYSSPKCDYDKVQLIVGGQDAEPGEFPHMAAIGWPLVSGGIAIRCGGTLLSENFVLTAGHCLFSGRDTSLSSSKPTIVRLGDQNIDPAVYDGAAPIDVPIKRIIKHPNYNSPNKYNDLGLLELVRKVEFSSAIRPACLWPEKNLPADKKAIATGWGITKIETQTQAKELQKVTLDILDNKVCAPLIQTNRHWKGFVDTQMCAGELAGGKDTCQGDSGGPLMLTAKENLCIFYVVGVTSFGGVCGAQKSPAVYTRVSSYLTWIESQVWPSEATA